MTTTLLTLEGVSRRFGKVQAVNKLSFSVHAGEIFGFIGPNGSGKTTTMRILATLDLPDSGDAFIQGESILVEPRKVRKHIGFMPDSFHPYRGIDVIEYLDFFARAYGLRGRERIHTVRSVSSFCGLLEFKERRITDLSKGMGQRLHLAKTLLHDPALLILDEPAAGLDPRARIEFRELLKELSSHGKGILISSHILSELGEICDGAVVIERGRKVVSGSIEEMSRKSKDHHRLRVRVIDQKEEAERFFLTQPGVRELTVGAEGIHFDFEGDQTELARLLERAVRSGLPLFEFHLLDADLEEIFMRTTEGRLQ